AGTGAGTAVRSLMRPPPRDFRTVRRSHNLSIGADFSQSEGANRPIKAVPAAAPGTDLARRAAPAIDCHVAARGPPAGRARGSGTMIVPVSSELVPADRVAGGWEEPACPPCDGRARDLLLEAPDAQAGGRGLWFAVVRCRGCGLLFTSPRPDETSIGQFYPTSYRPHRRRGGARRPRRWYPLAAICGRT